MNQLKAKKGQWLTNVSVEDESSRIFVKAVCGMGDLNALFRDATDEEKQAWEKDHPVEEAI